LNQSRVAAGRGRRACIGFEIQHFSELPDAFC
jgi:hypothetical protein